MILSFPPSPMITSRFLVPRITSRFGVPISVAFLPWQVLAAVTRKLPRMKGWMRQKYV
jgi:hypothetical protein